MSEISEVIKNALIYSGIAFSIVFIVLGILTTVIFAMRGITGSRTPSAPASGGGSVSAAAPPPVSYSNAAPAVAVSVKAQHVAAITAAVLSATQGRGRVLDIVPAQVQAEWRGCPSRTDRWRSAGIIENVGNHLAPTWKR
jgi:Na+-transporting methylmalonyl-CoA/oxaloacetate decarboxylase gamma subunit